MKERLGLGEEQDFLRTIYRLISLSTTRIWLTGCETATFS